MTAGGTSPGGAPARRPVPGKVRPPRAGGLLRERLLARLADTSHRLSLVVAPAGAGKTTLLAQLAARVDTPVGWYRPEPGDTSESDLVHHLEAALACTCLQVPRGWTTVDDALGALEACAPEPILLLVDDLHVLAGTAAERALERLVTYLPPGAALVAASRARPGLDLPRLRVAGELREIDADDLRFRAWEVERLFREVYDAPLPPEDLARLARRTEGWAAGLQLFHLATQARPWAERRRVLATLCRDSRLVREYLTRNVLDRVGDELRRFLLDTCVLPVLNGELCDRLRNATGGAAILRELERRQVFTTTLDAGRTYRYHHVLRSHLQGILVEEIGEAEVRARHLRAGRLLESAGHLEEALRAYCRGEDWDGVARLLGHGERLVSRGSSAWVSDLPPSVVSGDPWLMLLTARQHLSDGRLGAALEAYREAEAAFGTTAGVERCRRERTCLQSWLDPLAPAGQDPLGLVRAALRGRPGLAGQAARKLAPGAGASLAATTADLLAGRAARARTATDAALEDPLAEPLLVAAGWVVRALCDLLLGDGHPRRDLHRAAETFEHLGVGWPARMTRGVLAALDGSVEEIRALGGTARREATPWEAGLEDLLVGLAGVLAGQPRSDPLITAGEHLSRVGARTLEAWARALEAVARARTGDPRAADTIEAAAALARGVGVPGAEVLALLARTVTEPADAARHLRAAEAVAVRTGVAAEVLRDHLALPPSPAVSHRRRAPTGCAGELRCFGGFRLVLGGREIDPDTVRPRAADLLRLLALHPGRPLHRETLIEALWPGIDLDTGVRNLQVAVSTVRRLLEPEASRGQWRHLVRRGEAYELRLDPDADVDLLAFSRALKEARHARATGDRTRHRQAIRAALAAYAGELLPEAGPAEWVVAERQRYAARAAEAAQELADLRLTAGDAAGAVAAARRGLAIDRYRELLWRLLAEAHERTGDRVAAARTRRAHAEMLAELGIETAGLTAASGTRSP